MNENFGTLSSGEPVERICLRNDRMRINVLTFGATIQDIRIKGHDLPLVLGFDHLDAYLAEPGYFGAIVGRVANRIAHGQFELDGKSYQIDRNLENKHTLHGGYNNIGLRNWAIIDQARHYVVLEIIDADGAAGFSGNCKITCKYSLGTDQTLNIELSAICDQTTICNLAHHSYFNLDGNTNIMSHELQLAARNYLPVNDDLIPTGEIKPVENSRFDFQTMRSLSTQNRDVERSEIDHNFCLPQMRGQSQFAGRLYSPKSKLELAIHTDQPGLQVYTGGHISPGAIGLSGKPYYKNAGIAFEPQYWPDAPNHPNFPSITLKKGDVYRQRSSFKFVRHD